MDHDERIAIFKTLGKKPTLNERDKDLWEVIEAKKGKRVIQESSKQMTTKPPTATWMQKRKGIMVDHEAGPSNKAAGPMTSELRARNSFSVWKMTL